MARIQWVQYCCFLFVVASVECVASTLVVAYGTQSRSLLSDTSKLDIALQGACSSDILYHCSHILTESQKQAVHGNVRPVSSSAARSSDQALGASRDAARTKEHFASGTTTATDNVTARSAVAAGSATRVANPVTGHANSAADRSSTAEDVDGGDGDDAVVPADAELLLQDDGTMVDEEEEDVPLSLGDNTAGSSDGGQTGSTVTGGAGSLKREGAGAAIGIVNFGVELDEMEEEDEDRMQLTEEGLLAEGERRAVGRRISAASSASSSTSSAAHAAVGYKLQRTSDMPRRRGGAAALGDPHGLLLHREAGGGGSWGTGAEDEAAQLLQQQGSLPAVLQRFGLDSAPVRDLAAANAPIARCLRHAIHQGLLSLSLDAPRIGADCKLDVRNFFMQRSTDIRRDLPLLASCASDIEEHCAGMTSPQKVLGCLKGVKGDLLNVCRAAVTTHQIESSEDLSLDPDLAEACTPDRERLCSDVGWGEGAAQACLLSYINAAGSSSSSSQPATGGEVAAGVEDADRVSAVCDAALFRRQMQDSEDIRFNYQLARACSMDRQALCSDVRPGRGGVLGCLERQLISNPGVLDAACSSAMREQQRSHAHDARLDYHFSAHCSQDVVALCSSEEANLLKNVTAPRGVGAVMLECLRAKQGRIRNTDCKKYVFGVAMAMYHDNTLDGRLQSACALDMGRCRNPAAAINCLRDSMRRYGDISLVCMSLVMGRLAEAASDLAFNPALRDACAGERLTFCSHAFLQGGAVIDCLADSRHLPAFGEECRGALLDHLEHTVSDIRMMTSLRTACQADISELCVGVAPGEGRVISCLQQNRGQIGSRACRTQLLRLLGFVVEDARMDFQLMQACRSDAQQFCAGVAIGGGLLHECLRDSWDHLSKECKKAEAEVETIEHEDVRLNPRLQRACPHATTMFCHGITPGDANVISCLLTHMNKPNFPGACKKALNKLLDRSSTRYTLNPRLKRACEQDRVTTCGNTVDDPESVSLGPQDSTLGCLASNSSLVQPECRAEIAAAVKVQLTRYRVGMPLTSVCDGDVMTLCSVDMLTASLLERGYVQSCLVKHVSRLHAPCFALISMFDDKQFEHAVEVEKHWKGGMRDDQLQKVAADVRRELEPQMMDRVTHKITHEVKQRHDALSPRIDALLNSVAILLLIIIIVMGVAAFSFRKRRGIGAFVIKNASN